MTVEFQFGDIEKADVDAIVVESNTQLMLGPTGRAIRVAHPTIGTECFLLAPIGVGNAAITGAGKLKASYVIHAAAKPLTGRPVTSKSCRDATRNSLLRAQEKGLKRIAFSTIGAGIHDLGVAECARNMLETIRDHAGTSDCTIDRVTFVMPSTQVLDTFKKTWQALQ